METLNAAVLGELQSFMDADEFVAFIQRALQKLQQQAPVLLACIADQHWDEARHLAHRLKGTLGSLGCERLAAALNSLEEGLRQKPPCLPQAQTMAGLEFTIQETLSALQQRCGLASTTSERSSSHP
jgi:HPt (histidine-containing phosphotransfer) domain-containing protein